MGAKRLQKWIPKPSFFKLCWESGKCDENILFTTLQPHSPPQKIRIFSYFTNLKLRLKPKGDQMLPKYNQNAPQEPPGWALSRKRLPTRRQKGPQGHPKMSLKSHPGGSLGAGVAERLPKAPHRGLQVPPQAQNDTKIAQNGTKNGATTLIERPAIPPSSSEIREKLAYIPGNPEEREAGIHPEQRRGKRKSWHTARGSPRREMQQPPKLSHAPACRGGMGEATLNSGTRGGAGV